MAAYRKPREVPRARTYEVTGPRLVGGAAPGETVTLELTKDQEARLIESGHVKPVEVKAVPAVKRREAGNGR